MEEATAIARQWRWRGGYDGGVGRERHETGTSQGPSAGGAHAWQSYCSARLGGHRNLGLQGQARPGTHLENAGDWWTCVGGAASNHKSCREGQGAPAARTPDSPRPTTTAQQNEHVGATFRRKYSSVLNFPRCICRPLTNLGGGRLKYLMKLHARAECRPHRAHPPPLATHLTISPCFRRLACPCSSVRVEFSCPPGWPLAKVIMASRGARKPPYVSRSLPLSSSCLAVSIPPVVSTLLVAEALTGWPHRFCKVVLASPFGMRLLPLSHLQSIH